MGYLDLKYPVYISLTLSCPFVLRDLLAPLPKL